MLKYVDLSDLTIKETNNNQEIITKGTYITIEENCSISSMALSIGDAVKKMVKDLDGDKVYNFAVDILTTGQDELTEDDFESAVCCTLSMFFDALISKLGVGRQRERRLDVPENLKKDVNCNMSLLKRAINYKTQVDKFQLTISSRGLQYILVGGYDE